VHARCRPTPPSPRQTLKPASRNGAFQASIGPKQDGNRRKDGLASGKIALLRLIKPNYPHSVTLTRAAHSKSAENRIENAYLRCSRYGTRPRDKSPNPLCGNDILDCTIFVQLRPLFCLEIIGDPVTKAWRLGAATGLDNRHGTAGGERTARVRGWAGGIFADAAGTTIFDSTHFCGMRPVVGRAVLHRTLFDVERQPIRVLSAAAHPATK
jgi:hypothetical protein